MTGGAIEQRLREALGDDRVHTNAPLAPLTTFKVGGRADWLVHVRTQEEITRSGWRANIGCPSLFLAAARTCSSPMPACEVSSSEFTAAT
jgi:hypothetical protein